MERAKAALTHSTRAITGHFYMWDAKGGGDQGKGGNRIKEEDEEEPGGDRRG